METTLIILKPDTVQRGLMGRIIGRFEDKGLRIVGAKLKKVERDLAEKHYVEHEGKAFYPGLIEFITSTPVLVLAVRGPEAIAVCRKLLGTTKGTEAEPGTIRGDFGVSPGFNLAHGSDSAESAEREIDLWFEPGEVLDYEMTVSRWVHD